MCNVQKPYKATCVTLRTHVGVLYADGALFTYRFVREQRWFGLEIEGITHMIILSLSERWSFEEKKNLVVCSYEAQTLRNSCITSPLPSHQLLERTGEVLWQNGHFTKITAISPYNTGEGFFFWKKNKKNQFLEHVKFIFYINWWVDRACLELLSSVMRALYNMFLRYFFLQV